ncbi:MAG: MbnP family protein [Flavobacterium sp.]|uniref:MbnP family protein n=1 Tax=Flavobacterium sp. TaxID=239 RepID=UPI0032678F60
MIKKIIFSFVICLLFFESSKAQKENDSLFINLNLKFDTNTFELNKKYISKNKDTLQLNLVKFYISKIQIEYTDKSIFSEENSYHLVDIENRNSLKIPICKRTNRIINKITFNVGVDSLANTSGALSGDLDPTKGMYWAWQSGFINMKIEGKSSSCKTRKNEFQFHIGGYLNPNYAMQEIDLFPKSNQLDIGVNLAIFFNEIQLSKTNSVMIPGKNAMELAHLSTKMFYIE